MSSEMLAYLEVLIILQTALLLGILLYQCKKGHGLKRIVLSLVVLLWGFGICILMSSLEKDRISGSLFIVGSILLYCLMVSGLFMNMVLQKSLKPGKSAVIEAFDKMDFGACYYDATGRVILCNEYMHELAGKIMGTRVLNGLEFEQKLVGIFGETKGSDMHEFTTDDKQYSAKIGKVLVKKEALFELIVVDITGIKDKEKVLIEDNERLTAINKHLHDYGDIADTVIREQEILNAKIMVHDRLGDLLLTTKKAIEEKLPDEDLGQLVKHIKDTLSFMTSMEEGKEEEWEELLKTAVGIGVQVHLTGLVPEKKELKEIVFLAIRECLTNTVRHANGHNLYVTIASGDNTKLEITNDGDKPKGAITMGTGLSALKAKVDKAEGDFQILTEHGFVLRITI